MYIQIYILHGRSEEELEAIQSEVQKENENYEQLKIKSENLQLQVTEILDRIHRLCLKMKVN